MPLGATRGEAAAARSSAGRVSVTVSTAQSASEVCVIAQRIESGADLVARDPHVGGIASGPIADQEMQRFGRDERRVRSLNRQCAAVSTLSREISTPLHSPPPFGEQLADRRPRIAPLIDGFAMDSNGPIVVPFAAPSIESWPLQRAAARVNARRTSTTPRCAFCFQWRLMGVMISHLVLRSR